MHATTAMMLVAFSFAGPATDRPITPADHVVLAYRDLASLGPNVRPYIRYLSLYTIPTKDRELAWRVLSGHVNGLSTEPDLVAPAVVPFSGGALLRVNIEDYSWSAKVWEQLAPADPYFHAVIQVEEDVDQPYGLIGADGKWRQTETRKEKQKVKKFSASAPWLVETPEQALAIKGLIELTQSQVPIVRGDFFLWQTSAVVDREPNYYTFLGIKNRADYEKLVGFDATLAKQSKRTALFEAVAESGVAQQPRRIEGRPVMPPVNGPFKNWVTLDNQLAIDQNNPLRVLNGEFKHKAEEHFGPSPNGWWITALFNEDGTTQATAPDFIGGDTTSPSNDKRIHSGISCVRCHYPNSGLNPFEFWIRDLVQPPLALQSPSAEKLRELRQLYLRDIAGPMDDDRRAFARVCHQATGLTPKDYGKAYGDFFARYDSAVDLERAATDLGVEPEVLRKALDLQIRTTGATDTVLSTLLLPKQRRKAIPIRQWAEVYPLAQIALRAAKGH